MRELEAAEREGGREHAPSSRRRTRARARRRRGGRGRRRARRRARHRRRRARRDRMLPRAELDRCPRPGCSRSPCRRRTAAPTCRPRRSPRCSGCSRPATPASPRSRTATSSTSTRCATRARPQQQELLLRRGAGGQAVRQRPVRARHQARPRHPHHAAPAGRGRLAPHRREGLLHRRAVRRLDPGAGAPPSRDGTGPLHVAWVERHAPGVTVVDDWDGMGQRTTASGTVGCATSTSPTTGHAVPPDLRGPADLRRVRPGAARRHRRRHRPRRARDAAEFVRTSSRPYPDAEVERAADDPLVVQAFGEMEVAVRAAEALLARPPGRSTDADADLTAETAAAASLAVAAARALSAPGVGRGVEPALRGRRHPLGARLRSTSTGTGATPAPTPCTTRPRGRSSTSAATRRRHPAAQPRPALMSTPERTRHEVPLVPAHQRR